MTNALVSYAVSNGVAHVQFLRPEKRNALTTAMYIDMVSYLAQAEQDSAVRCVVFSGAGEHFSAGNDLADFLNAPPMTEASPVVQLLFALARATKPLIAAVEGFAVGIGTTLLLHCDFAYAARDAKFSLPFVNLALVPEAASSLLLPKIAGYTRAAELLMLGEAFDSVKATHCGLLTDVCEHGQALARALETAEKLSKKPPAALRSAKRLMKAPLLASIESAIHNEIAIFTQCLQSPEAKEAFQAFMEKRAPDFSRFE